MERMVGGAAHDPLLVVLSAVIAIAAGYTALDLAGRIRDAERASRFGWIAAAAVVMGGGIWAMHFVAMLAFRMGRDVPYDGTLTLGSFLVAISATGTGFLIAGRASAGQLSYALGGVLMGLGICGMHYLGISAMRVEAQVFYEPLHVIAALVIAAGASTAALWLAFRANSLLQKGAAALAMGFGVIGMHYMAMHGTRFDVATSAPPVIADGMPLDHVLLGIAITAATLLVLGAAILAAMYDRRISVFARREADALRRSEERFRHLYARTPLPLHSLNAAGRIEQVSDRWLALFGYRRDEVIGHALTEFMTPESARQRNEQHWPRLLNEGELREAEYRLVAKNGRVHDCMLSAVAERDADGHITSTLCGLVDVTERRRAEAALRQAQKLEAVGQLTGGVAHDFNNLLAVILGNLELARKRVPDDPRLLRLIDNTIQGAQRGAALTQRMLAFARRQDLKPEPVDVPELVLGMADLLRRSIGPTVRIEMRFPLGLPLARADANQLELALLNLAVNARDAMPGGGTIVIGAREVEIGSGDELAGDPAAEGPVLAPGRYFCLSITDSGEGMDEDTLARATEPFFTTKGVGKGTGLGLAMVHGLAAQSGGRLVMSSVRGEGTTAEIFLPIAIVEPAAEPEIEVVATSQMPDGQGVRVLVVDDDVLVLTSTAAMLEDLGYTVTEASSGMEALRFIDAGAPFDVVLTDQAMPGMTGLQLVAAIRERRPTLPAVLGTGYAELPENADPAQPRLSKPFSRDALERAILQACRPLGDNVVSLQKKLRRGD
ncbi:PAS domain S-box protein [Ancylobacter sp. 6x-1]|uniref:histidine kinase n=1 Tax=Ancylobacter crimeensis TaxID=2579147 RepID=A0ABT0D9B1_9HYPH|nr:MHYT domain-containing protein [Ancylobacter crimeensis]MCK0196540.1 PAS domain S-box protein [Ancylobacter crimeensis]